MNAQLLSNGSSSSAAACSKDAEVWLFSPPAMVPTGTALLYSLSSDLQMLFCGVTVDLH